MHDRPARPTAFCWNQKYPRVCGEKTATTINQLRQAESPPHMRGKDGCVRDAVDSRGITPAYAGKRTPCRNTSLRYWDHPRVCGEKKLNISPVPPHQGSPPHMRGKEIWRLRWTTRKRITPAYAGKSFRGGFWGGNCRDHPRVCGEKIEQRIRDYQAGGSPPHMRGKAKPGYFNNGNSGITPVYAGKRLLRNLGQNAGWDHPRICGEKTGCKAENPSLEGSPPHMQGKGGRQAIEVCRAGITPAYAGKSNSIQELLPSCRDHPRICGERKGVLDDFDGVAVRITPACAGKRVLCSKSPARRWDHPRVCGEKLPLALRLTVQGGSPPRMRGKGKGSLCRRFCAGITPAYAGKSVNTFVDNLLNWDHPRVCGEKA